MYIFEPFRTQWSPSRTALVFVPATSEPSPGLVMVASGRLLPTTSRPPTRSCVGDRLGNGAGESPDGLSISAAPVRLSGRRLGGPMKYMLLIYGDETAMAKLNEAERAALFRDYGQF